MTTLNTAAVKHNVTTKRSNAIGRALLIRKLNRLLANIGRAMHTSSLVRSK
ncbi:hypothetical protein [Rheinheimera maricola]|uniref:Transposase n=1 Tax=Rheinheimera maricola TaxID=2793282 RepID=A0ABS7X951_9GAMM|nr:hypothetical protein [Rheinheimera maricola]MBZ9612070.1 hypothetical protein [Rheinheimera maricola]